MECFAGLTAAASATAGAVGAKATFDYNRENFLDDREMRWRKELRLMHFRIDQSELWRADVRDLISLTEYKMRMYLIVNVLMLSFTVILWCEGKLPMGTPEWLMLGSTISIAGAFVFLLLSIWFALHAAISAQATEARILTQMVRLPIPSWNEVESCRTYGSEFEKVEPRQMFRVPWLMGPQEGLVSDPPSCAAGPGVTLGQTVAGHPSAAAQRAPTVAVPALSAGLPPADPWGLERRGDRIYELGCDTGHDVAKLRHVMLTRRAATYWQTYDAFARVSMSFGTSQLLLSMCYYLLGYVLVEVGCRTAATYGVIMFVVMQLTLLKLDVSLPEWQTRFLQCLTAAGPLTSCLAANLWSRYHDYAAEFLIPMAFVFHGAKLTALAFLSRVKQQANGAILPTAFRPVLFLDVFGWIRDPSGSLAAAAQRRGDDSIASPSLLTARSRRYLSSRPSSLMTRAANASVDVSEQPGSEPSRGSDRRSSDVCSGPEEQVTRPAIASVAYTGGRAVPSRPEDFAPPGVCQDLRNEPNAPRVLGRGPVLAGENAGTDFFDAANFLGNGHQDDDITTGHGREVPGILPWRTYSAAMFTLCLVWFVAAFYSILDAGHIWEFNIDFLDDYRVKQSSLVELPAPRSLLQYLLPLGSSPRYPTLERVPALFPLPGLALSGLSCDDGGRRFVAVDRLLVLEAKLADESGAETQRLANFRSTQPSQSTETRVLSFSEVRCPTLVGEGVQDATVTCSGPSASALQDANECGALVLHRHGRRIASCPLGKGRVETAAAARSEGSADHVVHISDGWRARGGGSFQDAGHSGGTGKVRPSFVEERVSSISVSACRRQSCASETNTFVGTTHGQVVQLKGRSNGHDLIPTAVIHEGNVSSAVGTSTRSFSRTLSDRYLGVLQPGGRVIKVLDASHGGLPAGDLALSPTGPAAVSFCAGGGHVYLLTVGRGPEIWRFRIPRELLAIDGGNGAAPLAS